MSRSLHHAPADCPVCGHDLIVIRKGCLSCGTELVGEFASCEFCALDSGELDVLKVFLASRGNLREVEKHLGVSYPTARLRLSALLEKLGLDASDPEPVEQPAPGDAESQILAQVAAGTLSAEDATALLRD